VTVTLRQQIEAVLTDGPATAGEVSLELGRNWRQINAYLRNLWVRGLILRELFYPSERGQSIRRRVWMYRLPTTSTP
jgi:predicted ArsR family transcriptional regulator